MLTIKPRQTNTQWHALSSNTTQERFNSTRSTKGRDLYLTEIISDIGEFSHLIDYHGVCGNNNEVSFVTNLLVVPATNRGKVSAEYELSRQQQQQQQQQALLPN